MAWDDRTKAAFDGARDSTKQVLTLSIAILTLTVTFSDGIVGEGSLTSADKTRLQVAWVCYGVSVLFGVFTLLALAGSVGGKKEEIGINDSNVRIPASVQMLAFVVGTGVFVLFAAQAV